MLWERNTWTVVVWQLGFARCAGQGGWLETPLAETAVPKNVRTVYRKTCAISKYVCAPVSTPATSIADTSVSTAQEQVPPFSWNSCF